MHVRSGASFFIPRMKLYRILGGFGAIVVLSAGTFAHAGSFGWLKGRVWIGPTCPVQTYPSTQDCADRPYVATLSITTQDGFREDREMARVTSDKRGKFRIRLPVGNYRIQKYQPEGGDDIDWPTLEPQSFTVKKGKVTRIDLHFDSGVR